jgi:hypothetical protein
LVVPISQLGAHAVGSRVQLAVAQHELPGMHRLPQTVSPATEQAHVPPAPEHVSPVTAHPVAGQQLVLEMHALFVEQKV